MLPGESFLLGASHLCLLNMEVVRRLDYMIVVGPFQLNHSILMYIKIFLGK